MMNDERIVELLWERDESALNELLSRYGRYLRAIALRITGSAEDAEECVNDALDAAWNSIPPHRPEALSAYLAKLVRRVSLATVRRRNAAKRGGGDLPLPYEELEECVPSGGDLTKDLEAKELAAFLAGWLRSRPEKERTVFLKRYFFFQTVDRIAKETGLKKSSVKMTLLRCRERLREALIKEGYLNEN